MNPNAAFIRTLLNTRRDLACGGERLSAFVMRRGFALSEHLENELKDCAEKIDYEAECLAHLLNQYLDWCETRKGGE